jgi:hypothetical protein
VSFPDTLADTGKDGYPLVKGGHGMHELHDKNGLANTRSTEQACLAALDERAEQVDDLDPGFENFSDTDRLVKRQQFAVDISIFLGLEWLTTIERFAKDVEEASEAIGCDRNMQRRTGIKDRHAAIQVVTAMECDGASMPLVEMLMDLEKAGFIV